MVTRILTYSEGTYLSIEDASGRWYVMDADLAAYLPPPMPGETADRYLIDTENCPPADVTATGVLVVALERTSDGNRYCLRSLDGKDDLALTPREYATIRAAGRLAMRIPLSPCEWSTAEPGTSPFGGMGFHLLG